ncbi:MAG: MTAP family purine nucleoside phosphorylase [Candidatus Hermodarchaeota archaeon]
MLGIIGGTALAYSKIVKDQTPKIVQTPYGEAQLFINKNQQFVFINRHGKERTIPPHMINHRANLYALFEAGVKAMLSITSTGSLKSSFPPGSFAVSHDYMQLTDIPTFFDDEIKHVVPNIDEPLRSKLIDTLDHLKVPYTSKAIYIQTKGPRLETQAEIRMFSQFADIVGMNFSSEAALANELKIPIANLSSIDNWANGITTEPLSFEKVMEMVKKNTKTLESILLYFIDNY